MENFYNQIKNIASKYNNNKIYIIGKGASIDKIDANVISDSLVININDSAELLQGNIAIFYKNWVLERIKNKQIKNDLYITSNKNPDRSIENVCFLPFASFDEREKELFIYRFLNEEIKLEEFLFLTAIKLCSIIYNQKEFTQEVYFLGFDFDVSDRIYSRKLKIDFSRDNIQYKKGFIRSQEFYFVEILNLFKETERKDLKLFHVGNKVYSALSPMQFNLDHGFQKKDEGNLFYSIKIQENNKIDLYKNGDNYTTKIVAEITNNHLGDIERLKRMIFLAKDAGADYIKVQKRNVDKFYTKEQLNSFYKSPWGNTLREYRKGVELNLDSLIVLDNICREIDIEWFSTILDYESFEFLNNNFKNNLFKIPSTISEHTDFHKDLADKYKGDIVISTGYTNLNYEEYILNVFKENSKIFLLQATSAYPTKFNDCNVAVVRHYYELSKKYPKIIPGYSSHDIGSLGSMLAVAAGAKMIEKHVKLGKTDWIHFDNVALDLEKDEFSRFVSDIRLAEQICGSEIKQVSKQEHHKYLKENKINPKK